MVWVFLFTIPITFIPDSLSLMANRVKSLSLDTMQNPSNLPVYSKSMASMIKAESESFLRCIVE
jgi:hypothetical protein